MASDLVFLGSGYIEMKWLRSSAVISATLFGEGAALGGELFSTDELLPSEEAALFRAIHERAEAAKSSLGTLNQMQILLTLQPFMLGDCGGFPAVETLAAEGDSMNQYLVGTAFINGLCVAENRERGLDWLTRSARGGVDQAAVDLAQNLFGAAQQEEQISRDRQTEAVELLKEAADRSNKDANLYLGFLYRDGLGVPMNLGLAQNHLNKAAAEGDERAIYATGKLYLDQNAIMDSLDWFLFGAERGQAINQVMSAAILADTLGPQNLVEAYKWANIAAASSSQENIIQAAEQIRSNLEESLTWDEITLAQGLSSDFEEDMFAKPPTGTQSEDPHHYSYDELVDPTATPEQVEAREELKARGVPINRIAFFQAIQSDDFALVEIFVRAGASLEAQAINAGDGPYGATPLYVAVDWGAEKTYRYLMDQSVNLNTSTDEAGYTPLVRALAHGRYEWARELLDAGADATMLGDPDLGLITSSALGFAVGTEHVELVRRILASGGSVDERYSSQMTPLQSAISFGGSAEVIQLLLEEGADPNAVGNFETMLDAAFDAEEQTVRTEAMALLLEYGANPEVSKMMGGSPLLIAASFGNPAAIKLLLESGADPNRSVLIPDSEIPMSYADPVERDIFKNGVSPLAMAAMMGNIGAATTLIEAGADTKFVIHGATGDYSILDLAERAGVTVPGL